MNVNLRHLEAFAAVARLCSFTAAARLLHLSQPALTVQIRQLEETLTVRLLDRNTRSVKLTRAGEELAPVVERLLAEIDSVVSSAKEMSGKTKGAVKVAALPSIAATLLPRIIVGFRRRYPGVSVMVHDVVAERVVSMVRSEHVDLGLGSPDADGGLTFTLLFRDYMRLILPVGLPLRHRAIGLADLTGHPLVLPGPDSSVRRLVDVALFYDGAERDPATKVLLCPPSPGW